MRILKILGIFVCVLALGMMVVAKTNSMGIKDVSHATFNEPVRVGAIVLPAGDYTIRHTMEGETHVMVFQKDHSKDQFKIKCTLVPLSQTAQQDQTIYKVNAQNEKVLQELVFRGDKAKHVF